MVLVDKYIFEDVFKPCACLREWVQEEGENAAKSLWLLHFYSRKFPELIINSILHLTFPPEITYKCIFEISWNPKPHPQVLFLAQIKIQSRFNFREFPEIEEKKL